MRTTRLTLLAPFAALLALPSLAAASCYSIYDAQNRLAFQSTVAPVDLSARISDAMRTSFPGGFLVMIPDDADCREIRTGATLSPRFDAGAAAGSGASADQALQAPLLRGSRNSAVASDGAATGSETMTRDAVRSGNALNIKRQARP